MKSKTLCQRGLISLLLFISWTAYAANDKAFFWQVSSENSNIYLMGSVHFADESFYPLRQAISKAFADSQYLVVELDIKKINHSVYTQLLQKKGVYKNGKRSKILLVMKPGCNYASVCSI